MCIVNRVIKEKTQNKKGGVMFKKTENSELQKKRGKKINFFTIVNSYLKVLRCMALNKILKVPWV